MGDPAEEKRIEEKRIFEAFRNDRPFFAGSPVVRWTQPTNDPPDIECLLENGKTVGLELTNWLDEQQIAIAKGQESIQRPFEVALLTVPNNTQHFSQVWMKVKRRLRTGDETALQQEMSSLMLDLDQKWDSQKDWQSPQPFDWNDFSRYPTLTRYFESLVIYPTLERRRSRSDAVGWLTFEPSGEFYSPAWAVDTLCTNIDSKIGKYTAKPQGLAAFFLLVHYDFKAFAYNTPVKGIDFSYPEAIAEASTRLKGATGVFDGIFVYVDIDAAQGPRSFRV